MSSNYNPTKWLGGKTIGTADIMNNIEKGISSAHDRIDEKDAEIAEIKASIEDILARISTLEQSNK